jgi:hypothetical protein
LGLFWRALEWKNVDICGHLYLLFYWHLVFFVVIWYIFPLLVCCTKSGNPGINYVEPFRRVMHVTFFVALSPLHTQESTWETYAGFCFMWCA